MHNGKQLLTAFTKLWQKYRTLSQQCQQDATEETIHKFRICCRRLLALIQLLQALAPQCRLAALRKQIKAQLDAFNELRDTQVMLLEIRSVSAKFSALEPFEHYLQLNEHRLLANVPDLIQNPEKSTLTHLQTKAEKALAKEFGKADLTQHLLSCIDNCHTMAMERFHAIDPEKPETLHKHRIAVKKLRYMLSAAKSLLPNLPDDHLKRLQTYLTYLGEFQNACVLLENLNRFFGHQPPVNIMAYYQQRQHDILHDYLAQRGEMRQFWRPTPHQPHPWDNCPN